MSRSRRQTPIFGNTGAPSEKRDKQWANRALRRASSQAIQKQDWEELVIPDINEVSNVWDFGKDGRHYSHLDAEKKASNYSQFSWSSMLRFTKFSTVEYWENYYAQLMRK